MTETTVDSKMEEKLHSVSSLSINSPASTPSTKPQPLQPPQPPQPTSTSTSTSTSASHPASRPLTSIQNIAALASPTPHPSTKPTDLPNPEKRLDPSLFGSRFLSATDNIYEFNAWDAVDPSTDSLFVAYAEQQYAFQREHRVSDFDRRRFNDKPEKWWDRFYGNNEERFFKDRKWLRKEFPVLEACTAVPISSPLDATESATGDARPAPAKEGEPLNTIMEVGAGAGNTCYPLLAGNANPSLFIHASDFSKKAVEVIRTNPAYDTKNLRAEVWDISSVVQTLPEGVVPGSVDVVLLIFIFSALSPTQWSQAVRNVWKALRPGGVVCLRDYGRGDLAQVRFKKGRMLGENFYVRGDGTRVYFFEEEELKGIWGGKCRDVVKAALCEDILEGKERNEEEQGIKEETDEEEEVPAFEIEHLGVDRRLLVNRQKQLKMYRCWMQARFRKPMSS